MAPFSPKDGSFTPKPVGSALPRPGDPLVLPDGSILYEEKRIKTNSIKERSDLAVKARDFRANTKRDLKAFPANVHMFKAVSVVFSMTAYGISNIEICETLNINNDQLDEIRSHHGYSELFNSVFNEFISANSEMLQSRIAAYSHAAVGKIGQLVTKAKKEEVQLAASKDILDRAGMRPQDLTANQQASQNELQIRITKKVDDVIVDITTNLGETNG
jgi:mevalonate kinase